MSLVLNAQDGLALFVSIRQGGFELSVSGNQALEDTGSQLDKLLKTKKMEREFLSAQPHLVQ